MIGPWRFTDLAQQDKLIPNGVQLDLRFYPCTDNFLLMNGEADKNFKILLQEMKLNICYAELNPTTIVGLENQLHTTPAVYPYLRSEIKTYNIAAGSYNFSVDDPFNGHIPAKLVVGFVSSEAYSGSVSKNPLFIIWIRRN